MVEKVIKITVDNTQANAELKETNEIQKDITESTEETNSGLSEMGGTALASAKDFKFMGISINGVSKSLKLLKVSLIATGIGAIVVVVGTLASAFLSTQEGVDALNKVLTPLKEVLDTIWGVAQQLGKGLFQMVSGDISAGFDTMADSVENLGDQMEEAWKRGTELYELQKQIELIGVNQNLVLSRLNRSYAEQLEIAEDLTKTEEERKTAYETAKAFQKAITDLKIRELDVILEAEKKKRIANDTDRLSATELNQIIADRETLIAEGLKAQTLLVKKLNTVKAEPLTEGEETLTPRNPATGFTDEELISSGARQIDITKSIQAGLIGELDGFAKKQKQIADNSAKADVVLSGMVKDAKVGIAMDGLGLIGMIAEEGSALAKGAAVAQATISGWQGVQNTFTTASLSPITTLFPAYPFIQAGLAGAFSAVQIANIIGQKKPSGGASRGGGGGSPAPRQQAPTAPSFNLVAGTGTNQIQDSIDSQNKTPAKAYVVSQDMTTQQQLDNNIKETASL